MTHVALTIAGSEASGGAGAQTDLKTFHQLGTFGTAALTCIVSFDPKNDWGHRFVPLDPQLIADQIEASTSVHDIDTTKIGMLGSPATIDTVAHALAERSFTNVVLEGEDAVDVFYDGEQTVELRSPKIGEERVNGAGCTLAAAVTAELAKGAPPLEAARTAKAVVTSSIEHRQQGHTPFDSVYQGAYRG